MATDGFLTSSLSEKLHQHRRHLAHTRSAARLTMESVAETEAETETDNDESSKLVARTDDKLLVHDDDVIQQPRCAPFFGVKHYLHNFYALPDDQHTSSQAQDDPTANLFGSAPSSGCGGFSRMERTCFRYTLAVGGFLLMVGVSGLLLGYFLPRHDIVVGRIEENELKSWVSVQGVGNHHNSQPRILGKAAPKYSTELEILDKYAIEYNSLLDTIKVGGLIALCTGALLVVLALVIPASSAASGEEKSVSSDSSPTKLGRTIQRCLPSLCRKTTTPPTTDIPTSLTLTDEKIPICEHVKRIQPSL